jgi:hypothetical protein
MEPSNIQRLKSIIDTHFKKINDLTSIINTTQITQEQLIPSVPDESKIVIVCHCSPKYIIHKQLYYIDIKNNKIIRELGKDVEYVDKVDNNPICKDNIWSNIVNGSKMYIWGMNCPIYRSFYREGSESNEIDDILLNSLRVLKKNGKVFFPVLNVNSDIFIKQNIELLKYFNSKTFNGFTFTLEPIDKFPYIIDLPNVYDVQQYYVFTKN